MVKKRSISSLKGNNAKKNMINQNRIQKKDLRWNDGRANIETSERKVEGIRVRNNKVFSFSKFSDNEFFDADDQKITDFEKIKHLYSAKIKYVTLKKEFADAYNQKKIRVPNTKIEFDYIIGDDKVSDAFKKANISFSVSVPGYGIQMNRTLGERAFYIYNEEVPQLQKAWEEKFGTGTLKIPSSSTENLTQIYNMGKEKFETVQQFLTQSEALFQDLNADNLSRIEETNQKLKDILLPYTDFKEILNAIQTTGKAGEKALAEALNADYEQLRKIVEELKKKHLELLNSATKIFSIKLQNPALDIKTLLTHPLEGIEEVVKLNNNLLHFIDMLVSTNKSSAKTVYKLLKTTDIKLLKSTIEKLKDVLPEGEDIKDIKMEKMITEEEPQRYTLV